MAGDATKIVVLDGQTLNPGDLSWSRLEDLGSVEVYERTPDEQVVSRAVEAEILITNKVPLTRQTIARLPKLKYVGVSATGYNVVDVEAARERGIPVTNVPVYGTNSVAQMVFAHLLNLTQRVADHAEAVREGRWASADDWCFWDYRLYELENMTMGIVGFGRIGQATARLAQAFGMRVIATTRSQPDAAEFRSVKFTDLDTLFQTSDVVSLHCPLTPETEGMVNRRRLAMMKPTAFLINTSRGPLVDEASLAEALDAGRLAGAGLDVMHDEPPASDNKLFSAKNCYVTPHIAWATREARTRLMDTTIDNVEAFLAGQPQNVVN